MHTDFLNLLQQFPGYTGQIAHIQSLPPRQARFATPSTPLPTRLVRCLNAQGIENLYTHQAAALDAARNGYHFGVVTATASGKTLCYQLPALEVILTDATQRALFLFPTKALAHDQLRALQALAAQLDVTVASFDGDTLHRDRAKIRQCAHIILSNPDMLHRTLLPDWRNWAKWLAQLRFVVLDEAHVYRGIFGAHVALIIRRLHRLCAYYGGAPQFICCSATSANPHEHLATLIGTPVTVIDDDGAPQGPRSFVLWNPPLIEGSHHTRVSGESGRRRSTHVETAELLTHCMCAGIKTLAFTRTRRGTELVLRYTREMLEIKHIDLSRRVASYRAGYTPDQRRELEHAFCSGALLGLVSTNALELGVDIGGVDAVIMGGFPGTIAASWQQAGRAGRSRKASLAVLVAQDDPLDQFYMRHPDHFFAQSHEYARVAQDNPYIMQDQLRCAAAELPLYDTDEGWFGPTFTALRSWLLRHNALVMDSIGKAHATIRQPAATVNIRSADGATVILKDVESGRVIEQISAGRAPCEIHPGAIYLYQGSAYLVSALQERMAQAQKAYVNYYTQAREETTINIERIREQRRQGPATLAQGVVEITRQVTGYRRKEHYSEALLSEHDLALAPQTFRTIAVWWTIPELVCRQLEQICVNIMDGLHALEHACIGLLPLFAQCDRADIGGLSTDMHPDTGTATIFVYDGVPGGVGIAQIGYEQAEAWWTQARTLLLDCPCLEGCPACIQSPKCGNGNQHLSKMGAVALVSFLLEQPVPQRDLRVSLTVSREYPATQVEQQRTIIADLQGRLKRARATAPGPQRAALLIALRYRISMERASITDAQALTALEALEAETILLE